MTKPNASDRQVVINLLESIIDNLKENVELQVNNEEPLYPVTYPNQISIVADFGVPGTGIGSNIVVGPVIVSLLREADIVRPIVIEPSKPKPLTKVEDGKRLLDL